MGASFVFVSSSSKGDSLNSSIPTPIRISVLCFASFGGSLVPCFSFSVVSAPRFVVLFHWEGGLRFGPAIFALLLTTPTSKSNCWFVAPVLVASSEIGSDFGFFPDHGVYEKVADFNEKLPNAR